MPGGINPGQHPVDLTPTDPNVQAALDQALRAFNLPVMSEVQSPARNGTNPALIGAKANPNPAPTQLPPAPIFRQPLANLSGNVRAPPSPTNANGKRPAATMESAEYATKDTARRFAETLINRQSSHDDDDNDEEADSDSSDDDGVQITHNCDQIRRLITRLLDSKEMTAKALIEKLSVSGPGYYRFMKLNGRDKGYGSDTYVAAMKFFQKREKKGIKINANKNKKAKTSGTASKSQTTLTSSGGNSRKNARAASGTAGGSASASSAQPVVLEGELENAVEVYDTCSTIRRKINAHLKKDGVTQASFLRELGACYHPPKTLQNSQLQRFRQMKGPDAGNTNAVYYAAYVFFEKERIRTAAKKSKEREEMEEIYKEIGGVDTKRRHDSVWARAGESVTKDKYGRWVIDGRTV